MVVRLTQFDCLFCVVGGGVTGCERGATQPDLRGRGLESRDFWLTKTKGVFAAANIFVQNLAL